MDSHIPCCYALITSQSAPQFQASELETLRPEPMTSDPFNQITGRLIFRDGHFLHYFEGPSPVVQSTLRSLRLLPHHKNSRLLLMGEVSKRLFNEWSKQCVQSAPPHPSSKALIELFETLLNAKTTTPEEILIIIRRFSQTAQIHNGAKF